MAKGSIDKNLIHLLTKMSANETNYLTKLKWHCRGRALPVLCAENRFWKERVEKSPYSLSPIILSRAGAQRMLIWTSGRSYGSISQAGAKNGRRVRDATGEIRHTNFSRRDYDFQILEKRLRCRRKVGRSRDALHQGVEKSGYG